MDIKDFQGLMKYKIIVPTMYILSWISMVAGPLYYPIVYQRICMSVLIFTNLKLIIYFFILCTVAWRASRVFKRVASESVDVDVKDTIDNIQEICYGFIIPSYREDVEMLAETLDILAAHKRARTHYAIFLAMEAHEQNSHLKAEELIRRYEMKFRAIDFTVHKVREFEQKGKASNVSWCAQHLEPIFAKHYIKPETVFLTIMDADSWAPNVYFDIMEEHLLSHYDSRHKYIYQPPQIFTRNHMDVPVFTRVYDIMHSFAHCANFYSVFNLTFPLSNYTLSYNLVKSIGFWDTCADAIGEDFHTTQKAYWKTGGNIETVPIYAPFNQVNIATGNGYVEDVLARFWQAERHAQGVSDLAWEFKMLFTQKFRPMNLIIWFQIFETFIMPGILPWVFISLALQTNVLFSHTEAQTQLANFSYIGTLFNLISIISTVGYFIYEYVKRRANTVIYGGKNQSILRIVEYPLLFVVNLFLISVPTFLIAAFGSLFANREYIVAEKKGTTGKI